MELKHIFKVFILVISKSNTDTVVNFSKILQMKIRFVEEKNDNQ
jgi:hypothetical protein